MHEPEIVSESYINDLDSHCNKLPALIADIGLVTTCSDIIIIRQIDIEAKLLGNRLECRGLAKSLSVSRIRAVYWANFESGGVQTKDIFSQARQISTILEIIGRVHLQI